MSAVVISLTTIPPRLPLIAETLHDLLAQTARIDEIRLYLPRKHRRFPLCEAQIPQLPKGVRLCLIDEDWGPATKVLPAARELRGQDVELIFCDDDQRYAPDWAAHFLAARADHPRACLVGLGYDLEHRPRGLRYFPAREGGPLPRARRIEKGLGYRVRRALSLGRWRPRHYTASGYVDILQGYRGAMIRPDFLPETAWDIPDVLWTVDDPWLSGQMLANGVPIWLVAGCPGGRETAAARTEGLRQMIYQDHGRREADSLAIEYFRHHYGLWPDRKPPQSLSASIPIPRIRGREPAEAPAE
ncbi:glycosyltransferase family 2 protein [Paracoccus suum]|uniref:Glycosyltransferase family 2 protein n=1 Tax=Paracoccus suum TaxID=2259340 RepID=A0A344PKB8_9RHOB|nr:glycosyltransferase family A protein [Paracoccus suum]AXC49823.1 glycosyltransferase family 2 protein [Paracoccus suum]